ncbi:factor of DNA methylation 3-like [Papaver somniferum]|uniref:factor of DNA methylation 3-like n=1 Tax=Papaver somniferum TaxID=3469 RepID=UPI000E6FAF63|nr:factor of DNA methylation 3-like [Papaver somniferum]
MGELDLKLFGDALTSQFAQICGLFDANVRDAYWHPFKITLVNGKHQELINEEEDELLKGLKNGKGVESYFAVVHALMELNEYNPCGRFPVPEL